MTNRPQPGEYPEYTAGYIAKVPDGEITDLLAGRLHEVSDWIDKLPEELGEVRYAPDKWTVKETLSHMIDTERVMSYRLLGVARGDQTPFPGFDQDEYVRNGAVISRTFEEIAKDYTAVRTATLTLLDGLSEEAWPRQGTVNGYPTTVRALAYIIAGHELHTLGVLREKYLQV
ncbi:DinB family protein [Paenibacillus pinistramenti]|uniref:DinB family protein n=1 Tax=Paenibacillus pinistramenti TaxID=1768003 RepID=UPI0011092095|nr:DinB family protein [Paenibacillus pinistramenti]